MVLAIIAIVATTIASVAIPFLFPTPAEKATVELNKKLESGRYSVTETQQVTNDKSKNNYLIIAVIAVIAVILVMVL